VQQRTSGVFDALVEHHGGFVFVVPIDVDARPAFGLDVRDGSFLFVVGEVLGRWGRGGASVSTRGA